MKLAQIKVERWQFGMLSMKHLSALKLSGYSSLRRYDILIYFLKKAQLYRENLCENECTVLLMLHQT